MVYEWFNFKLTWAKGLSEFFRSHVVRRLSVCSFVHLSVNLLNFYQIDHKRWFSQFKRHRIPFKKWSVKIIVFPWKCVTWIESIYFHKKQKKFLDIEKDIYQRTHCLNIHTLLYNYWKMKSFLIFHNLICMLEPCHLLDLDFIVIIVRPFVSDDVYSVDIYY